MSNGESHPMVADRLSLSEISGFLILTIGANCEPSTSTIRCMLYELDELVTVRMQFISPRIA